ncbi:histidine phosphatase family protein [Homoserinibacter sp. YIM 151385]|uniref:histidine phosphatase family protein n=1 Tax=Homoserinibacter sp. YIM 151385 TaxID=2985506 RepID=UPI0022F13444|nr:histidine phosphatase family protein [Homoserinibacter sp. YIM 151385]WBU38374.1 histidine phosphatase family protein [Homoserinibacter sp. YIM 151385]
MTRLLLIRHGQTPANVAGILETTIPGPGLTELGRQQAEALVEALGGEPIAAIHVSVMMRTSLTASPLAAHLALEPSVREGLHEIEAGALEGRADRDAVRGYLGTLAAWADGALDTPMPGGADGLAFFDRFDAAVARIVAEHPDDATLAIVSHGAAIRVWTGGRGANIDPAFTSSHELDNTGIVIVDGGPEAGWTVESWMGEPIGGAALEDEGAVDPAGAPLEDHRA